MMYAYDQTLLYKAQTTLAWMFDYGVNEYGLDIEDFYQRFINSGIAEAFGEGNPSVVAGKSGEELAYEIISYCDSSVEMCDHNYEVRRTREYWLGFCLAFYQWKKNESFKKISEEVPISDLLLMYDKYHEMDVEHFVVELDRLKSSNDEKLLKRLRIYAGMSQRQLAEKADIPLRTIQQYEQGQKILSKANGEYILRLASVLYCEPKDLL